MKRRLPTIFAIVVCLLLLVCLHRISSLHRKISQLESTVSNQHSDFLSSVNDLYSNIDTKLEEEASLLSASEWAYGELDPEQETVLLRCSITSKEFSPSETSATLISGEQHYPMELQNDVFVATVPLPLFSEQNSWKVHFSDSGTLRTETLDWYLSAI